MKIFGRRRKMQSLAQEIYAPRDWSARDRLGGFEELVWVRFDIYEEIRDMFPRRRTTQSTGPW